MQSHVIYLAGGCFWGVEEYFSRMAGVHDTEVGYANALCQVAPRYEDVCSGATDASEAVKVTFDDEMISLSTLLDAYFQIIDPTLLNQQGNDRGTQYRTGIYYVNDEDLEIILKHIEKEQAKLDQPIVTEILPIKNFFAAEEYHQDYLKKNPSGYCHIKLD